MLKIGRLIAPAALLGICAAAHAQDAGQLVEQAVRTELAADAADHTCWIYFDVDRKPDLSVKQWVGETHSGTLERALDKNGRPVTKEEARNQMESFVRDSSARVKQHKSGEHDDRQAAEMLKMLPQAFLWSESGTEAGNIVLHFKPNPEFHPPTYQSRVFAAMEGDMKVDRGQHRIVSLKGQLIHDVRFFGGLIGSLKAGGSFDVERRETGKGEWQITEAHIHIRGHALLFKSISEEEDEEKSRFKQLPDNISLTDAEQELLAQRE
jgi:hypothetical protein